MSWDSKILGTGVKIIVSYHLSISDNWFNFRFLFFSNICIQSIYLSLSAALMLFTHFDTLNFHFVLVEILLNYPWGLFLDTCVILKGMA